MGKARFCVCSAAIVLFSVGSASAAITVNGLVDDWPEYFRSVDSVGSEEGAADLVSWGAIIDGDVLFGFFEMAKEIDHYLTGTNDIWAGLWIDVDLAGGPGNTVSSLGHTNSQLGTEWDDGDFESFDINVEWGGNTSHWGEGFNYWGAGDNVSQQGSPVSGGQVAYQGNILEFSVPISDILAELATYPDDVVAGPAWKIGARVEASEAESGPWGGDNSDTVTVTSLLTADINRDGVVSSADLDFIRAHWRESVTPGNIELGDLDGDGIVSGNDLDIVRAFWGTVYDPDSDSGVKSVPEPLTWVLLFWLAVMSVARCRP